MVLSFGDVPGPPVRPSATSSGRTRGGCCAWARRSRTCSAARTRTWCGQSPGRGPHLAMAQTWAGDLSSTAHCPAPPAAPPALPPSAPRDAAPAARPAPSQPPGRDCAGGAASPVIPQQFTLPLHTGHRSCSANAASVTSAARAWSRSRRALLAVRFSHHFSAAFFRVSSAVSYSFSRRSHSISTASALRPHLRRLIRRPFAAPASGLRQSVICELYSPSPRSSARARARSASGRTPTRPGLVRRGEDPPLRLPGPRPLTGPPHLFLAAAYASAYIVTSKYPSPLQFSSCVSARRAGHQPGPEQEPAVRVHRVDQAPPMKLDLTPEQAFFAGTTTPVRGRQDPHLAAA